MIYIGTSGYSYKDWVGPFYPEGTKDSSMLECYSHEFNFVEINSTYYHMPGVRLFESINRKTGEDFRVAVKLFKGFTHERNLELPEAEKFNEALKPVTEEGKLLCLLAQFPYSFHWSPENMEYLKKLRQWFKNANINVEFRNQNWIRREVMQLLKGEELGFVCVDEPGIKGLIKSVLAFTSPISYLRMHGRNAGKWYGGEGSERYDYLYNEEELMEWLPRVKELEKNSSTTVVAFNNHPNGKAVQNARMLSKLLLD